MSEDRARELIAKGDKKLTSWSLFSSSSKYEDAEELYTKLCEHLTDELVTASKLAATPGCGLRALLQEPAGGVDVAVGLEPRWAQWSCPRRFPWGVHFRHGLERCAPPQLWPGR